MREAPGTTWAETSESALNDLKVGNVVQKVGCPRSIWIAALGRRRASVGPIGMSSTVGATGAIETVLLDLDGDQILNTIRGVIAGLMRAHF